MISLLIVSCLALAAGPLPAMPGLARAQGGLHETTKIGGFFGGGTHANSTQYFCPSWVTIVAVADSSSSFSKVRCALPCWKLGYLQLHVTQ